MVDLIIVVLVLVAVLIFVPLEKIGKLQSKIRKAIQNKIKD